MFNDQAEKTIASLMLFGAPAITLFLTTQGVTDPVNPTKLFLAGGIAFAAIFVILGFQFKYIFSQFRIYLIAILFFILAGISTIVQSDSPLSQSLYGSYGRNTGFIAYLFFSLLAIGSLGIKKKSSFRKLILALQFAGLVNVLYCAWVLIFGDFLPWNNPYGNILGLFGNPDFASAFLGIFIASVLAVAVARGTSLKFRLGSMLLTGLAFFEIVKSHAIQGIVVTLVGIAIIGFFLVRDYTKNKTWIWIFSALISLIGLLGVLGALQKGPFSFVYKTSVSLRGAYWHAGLKMGANHLFSGVGMDSYGDWYRRARSIHAATVLPGPTTISNAAHNVVIDIFAYGGLPLLVAYLAVIILTLISIVRFLKMNKSYDPVFVSIMAAWLCYELQSFISINQVGLAIWGWVLSGALIAYEKVNRVNSQTDLGTTSKKRAVTPQTVVTPALMAGIGMLLGLLIAVPPLSADMKWSSALKSRSVDQVLLALKPSYMNPLNSQELAQGATLLVKSNLLSQAHKVALQGVAFNSDYFEAWNILYSLPNSSVSEKSKAFRNMKRLDPLNPDVTKP